MHSWGKRFFSGSLDGVRVLSVKKQKQKKKYFYLTLLL